MHTKIAEPHPIFNKDKNKSNAKANLFTFYNRGKEPKKYNLIYFRNNIVKSFFIHIYGHEIEMYTVEQGEKRDKRQ